MTSEQRAQKFHTDDVYYPDLGSGSDWSCRERNLLQPIRSTTQIWVVIVAVCSRCSDFTSWENQWYRRKMSAVFSGYLIRNLLLLHFQPQNSTADNTGNLRFKNIPSSFAATFFMMLDNLQYDNILLNYSGSVGNGLVLYILYFAYCFMMPIIFLNLLVSRTCICCRIKLN